jgi:hypothetical protein
MEVAQEGAPEPASALSVSPEPSGVGIGERGRGGLAGEGPSGPQATSGRPVRVEAGERHGVAPNAPRWPGEGRAGGQPVVVAARVKQHGERSSSGAKHDLQQTAGGVRSVGTASRVGGTPRAFSKCKFWLPRATW